MNKFPPRAWIDNTENALVPSVAGSTLASGQQSDDNEEEYLSLAEHSSLLAAAQEENRRLREALDQQVVWLTDCRDAGYSNMEGAELKDFLYWEKWGGDCQAQIDKLKEPQ